METVNRCKTALVEPLITNGKHFINQQNVRVDVDRHGKAEPGVHARRIVLHRNIDESIQLGKLHNRVKAFRHLSPLHAENRGIEENIVPPRELRVKASAQLEQCRYSTIHADGTAGWGEDSSNELEKRALAGPIRADNPKRHATLNVVRHALQSPEFL